jgi:hypothetical protein
MSLTARSTSPAALVFRYLAISGPANHRPFFIVAVAPGGLVPHPWPWLKSRTDRERNQVAVIGSRSGTNIGSVELTT